MSSFGKVPIGLFHGAQLSHARRHDCGERGTKRCTRCIGIPLRNQSVISLGNAMGTAKAP
jgi:hypothetical protein